MSTREALLDAPDRDAYLAHHSGLPGPRADLALAADASDVASAEEASRWAASDDEYLALCGAMATARLGDDERLRQLANDDRWRVREGVVLGLQRHRSGDEDALRKALGYAWSVVVVAGPPEARARFEALLASDDPDVRWIVRANLEKARLERLDAEWVASLRARAAA